MGLEPGEDFWVRPYGEACRRGPGTREPETVVVLADGAEWDPEGTPKAAARFLASGEVEAGGIVDYYHAVEHRGDVAHAAFGAGTPRAQAWARPLQRRPFREGAPPVIRALEGLAGAQPHAAEEVRRALGYVRANAPRRDYPAFIARRFPIGSGAVESAGKLLVGEREKGAGMRWTREGAQAVAPLRALHRSGRWRAFWQTQTQRRRPPVARHASVTAVAA